MQKCIITQSIKNPRAHTDKTHKLGEGTNPLAEELPIMWSQPQQPEGAPQDEVRSLRSSDGFLVRVKPQI